jgi:hypothetical protein
MSNQRVSVHVHVRRKSMLMRPLRTVMMELQNVAKFFDWLLVLRCADWTDTTSTVIRAFFSLPFASEFDE